MPVKAGGVLDGSITLCWDLRAHLLTDVNVSTMTDATVNGVISGLLTQTDASKVCRAINLVLAAGVTGTVSATSHAHVAVNGAPPADWDHNFAKDLSVSPNGENIVLKSCFDSSGNVTTS